MKTIVITLAILCISQVSYLKAQTNYYPSVKFTPSPTKFKQYDQPVLQNNSSKTNFTPSQPNRALTEEVYREQTREVEPLSESRVNGYYEDGFGDNTTWKRISLKVAITTNSLGQDEIKVIAYMNEIGNWSAVSYGSVSKTFGAITKEFTYQALVSGKTVYFNI